MAQQTNLRIQSGWVKRLRLLGTRSIDKRVISLLPTPPPAQGRPRDSHGPANDGIGHPRTLFDILDDLHYSTDRFFPVFFFSLLFFLSPPARKISYADNSSFTSIVFSARYNFFSRSRTFL